MKIQAPSKQKNFIAPFFLALLILIVLGAGLLVLIYGQTPPAVPAFEVQTFAGKTEVSLDGKTWLMPNRGELLGVGHWIATGPEGEIDLSFGKNTFLRLKENSRVQIQTPQVFSKALGRLHLERGTVLVSNQEDDIEVSVPGHTTIKNSGFFYDLYTKFVVSAQSATFLVTAFPDKNIYQVSVLKGEVQVHPGIPYTSVSVKALEMIQGGGLNKAAISEKEWAKVRESYEIAPKSAAQEAKQLDLSKKAGNFFNYVFDHGTFFQEKWGFTAREFIQPEEAGAPIYLQADYDVFPKGSWVGLYFKTRNFDFSKVKSFSLDVKRVAEKNYPDYIRIEFKTKYNIIRTFAVKMVREDWQTLSFPVSFSKETPITEVTIMFNNDKVGPNKTGSVQFKNFNLEAAPEKPVVPAIVSIVEDSAPALVPQAETPKPTAPGKPPAPPAAIGDELEFK